MTTYRIAVIGGTGPQGKGLGYRFARAGHSVVLGSRSADTLSGLGPDPVRTGDRLPVGVPAGEPAAVEVPAPPADGPLRLHRGPRAVTATR